jgi:hypothetical protein
MVSLGYLGVARLPRENKYDRTEQPVLECVARTLTPGEAAGDRYQAARRKRVYERDVPSTCERASFDGIHLKILLPKGSPDKCAFALSC